MSFQPLVRIWILLSALASAAGWLLSAAGCLNGAGYAVFGLLGLVGFYLLRRHLFGEWRTGSCARLKIRFRRLLPLAFAGLAALVLLGGALYAPSNYDAMTYRLPRVLHWLAQGQWHWLHTANPRMNDRSCGFEWLMTPGLLFTRSDRALFLINFLPFLLLPGLVFSVFTRLGVAARVAWHWMWLLPTGYGFLLQAGSVGNDAFAAAYALAAVDFALRAAASRRMAEVWLSLLAAALMTGAKSGNLPLLLPWALLFLPVVPRLFSRPARSFAVLSLALLVSFLPSAIINQLLCGDWTGLALESPGIAIRNPLLGIAGNSAMFLASNFVPTFFPAAGWWNASMLTLLPEHVAGLIRANFEGNFHMLGEMPTEEWAGLGFGLSCLLAATVLARWFGPATGTAPRLTGWQKAVLAAPYVALFFFFAKSGMMTLARLVLPYYPLLLPALLAGAAPARLVRRPWWRRATYLVLALALAALVLTPARPLWPAQTVLARAAADSSQPLVKRVKTVYSVYADRADPLVKLRPALPGGGAVVGFAGGCNDTEISLWRPFGSRRVEHILTNDSLPEIYGRQIHYAVVGEAFLHINHLTIEDWLAQRHATIVTSITATMTVSDGLRQWYVVRLDEPARQAAPAAPPP